MPAPNEIEDFADAHLADAGQKLGAHLDSVYRIGGIADSTAAELRAAAAAVGQAVRSSRTRGDAFPGRAAELPAEERERAWRSEGEQFRTTSSRGLQRLDQAITKHREGLAVFVRPRHVGAAEQQLARQDLEASAVGEGDRLDGRALLETAIASDAAAHAIASPWGRSLLKRAGLDPEPTIGEVNIARARARGGEHAKAAEALAKFDRVKEAHGAFGGAVQERNRQHAKPAPRPKMRDAEAYGD